ncbi:MAG: efflux RND transporter permease subunit [Vicingaceae bacterium]
MSKTTAKWILFVSAILSLYFLVQVGKINFKYNFELFFPKNDANTLFFEDFKERFQSDRDFILIGLVNNEGIYRRDFLERIDSLTKDLEALENVNRVLSPTNAESYKVLPLYPGIYKQQILRFQEPKHYSRDSAKLHTDPNYLNTIVSEKGKAVCLVVEQSDDLNQESCFEISDASQLLLNKYHFDEQYIAGRCLGLAVYVRLIQNEVRLFVGTSVLLILVFLFIAYRKFWALWMPSVVVLLSVLWTVGLMSAMNKPIDLISNIIPTMLLVIGISNVIHLLSRFLDHMREGLGKVNSLKVSIKEVGTATIFTSLTTAIGFLSLTTSQVQPIIDMGLYTTIGLAFAFILTYTLFPALIVLNKGINATSINERENFWVSRLEKIYKVLIDRRNGVLIIWTLIAVIAGISASQLQVNSFLLDGLSADHPQRKAFHFFEKEFSGARPFELSVQYLKPADALSYEIISALDSIQNYLDSSYGVGSIISPVSILKNFNRTMHAGNQAYYSIPRDKKTYDKLIKQADKYQKSLKMEAFMDAGDQYYRFNGKLRDKGSLVLKEMNAKFEEYINLHFGNRLVAVMTGAPVMMDNTHEFIVKNVFRGLIGAILVIGLIMGLLFRSWRIVIISLLTNIIPLIITAGIMAAAGIEMRLSTSIIFIIAFGIAVDDSIHFLSKFSHEMKTGKTLDQALEKTFKTTGKAMIVTTLILSGGFLTLSMSEFLGTHYLGVYISLTLFIALLADLMILPAAIKLFIKKQGPSDE